MLHDLLLFTTELSDLLSSGMKLGQALGTMGKRETGRPIDLVIAQLRDSIIQGTALSDAMALQHEHAVVAAESH